MDLISCILAVCALICFVIGGYLINFAYRGLLANKRKAPTPDKLAKQIERMRKNTPGDIPIFDKTNSSLHIPIKRIKRRPLASDWDNTV
ncbi:hypothetical protein GF391_01845 [Candidatus Uhrbacteria bacterium]|nr:hypothetical protein [Candidatus Uhrbacteria bacterium]